MTELSTEFDPSIFPVAYGNELETSIMLSRQVLEYDDLFPGDERYGSIVTRYENPRNISAFVPRELLTRYGLPWLNNGFKFYDASLGSLEFPRRVEVATPECRTVDELALHTRVAEIMIERGSEGLLSRNPSSPINGVRIQKRVIDAVGNTWGCHDNYGFYKNSHSRLLNDADLSLGEFLSTRAMITGTGHYTTDGYEFSQKLGSVDRDKGYGFFTRHYRDAGGLDDNTGRIEVSSSDPNISDWATIVRIGSVPIWFATVLTGGHTELSRQFGHDYNYDVNSYGRRRNGVDYNPATQTLSLNREQLQGLEIQRSIAECFIDEVAPVAGSPARLLKVANEIINFCDDLEAVAASKKQVADLADRADWAARIVAVESHVASSPIVATSIDPRVIADINFDAVQITRNDDGSVAKTYGDGFKMRQRQKFQDYITDASVDRAYGRPPGTRAAARVALLTSGLNVSSADWSHVTIDVPSGSAQKIILPDPVSSDHPEIKKRTI